MDIRIRRLYHEATKNDGYRVLVDRVWPRGVSKQDAHLDAWNRDVAPTDDLRKWFGHDPDKWDEFKKQYKNELSANWEAVAPLLEKAREKRVTLVFGAKDKEHNNAVVLREFLEEQLESEES
ncbi:MAG: DUF488 family protein [Candidatus Hydrogenedentes bacterium]|nr:DUF488 family protein [Candidatus Hydrogenedentota bacterium]